MAIPYTLETFTAVLQDKFKMGIAATASVGCECDVTEREVNITRITENAAYPGSRRRLHAAGITVDVSIAVPDVEAGKLLVQSSSLSKDAINKELANLGVFLITEITSGPVLTGTEGSESQDTASEDTHWLKIGIAMISTHWLEISIVMIVVLVLVCGCCFARRRKRLQRVHPATYSSCGDAAGTVGAAGMIGVASPAISSPCGDAAGTAGGAGRISVAFQRKPVFAYDQAELKTLIVGTNKMIAPKSGFNLGVPACKFEVSSAATFAAEKLETLIGSVTVEGLSRVVQDALDVYDEIETFVKTMIKDTGRIGQLQVAASQQFPLSSALCSQSLEALERELTDLKAAQSAAVKALNKELMDLKAVQKSAADAEEYDKAKALKTKVENRTKEVQTETQALKAKHDTKTQEVSDYKRFKSQFLDPLQTCCTQMAREFGKLGERAKRVETASQAMQTRSKEIDDSAGAIAQELEQVSTLADRELLWLKMRDLSSLQSTAVSASQVIMQRAGGYKSVFTSLMQQAGVHWSQSMQCQKTALDQITEMQKLISNMSSKPLVMQQNIGKLVPQITAEQLQRVVDNMPRSKIIDLKEQASLFVGSITISVRPSLEMLKKAPVMPQGVNLNTSTGVITANLVYPVANCGFTVRAYNASGECVSSLSLSAEGQIPPSGLTYAIIPPSEFSNPPWSPGLLLVGDTVSIKPTYVHAGLPRGNFSPKTRIPAGLKLNVQTGELHGSPSITTARKEYTVTLQNPTGSTDFTMSLEVQQHTFPGPLKFDEAFSVGKHLHKIFLVNERIDPILPVQVDKQDNLLFSVSPDFPVGMCIDSKTSVMTGTPSVAMGKTTFTVTARNMRGKQEASIVLAVAGDWQMMDPQQWSVNECLLCLKDELRLPEQVLANFVTLDGEKLISLRSPEAVVSKYSFVEPAMQVLIAQNVKSLLAKWEAPEKITLIQRPIDAQPGQKAQLEYFPYELRRDYRPSKVLGVGATGIVVLADLVKNGHVKCQVAIKLIFAGEATRGFSETAIRRLEREGTILSRLKSQHIVTLLSYDLSENKEVFWLVMEYLDGSSLDVVMQDPHFTFDENSVVRLAQQILSALHTLHQSKVIHRDIKPSNIVKVNGTDQFKLVDVGSAAVVDVRNEEVSHSLKSQRTSLNMAGTHAYIPPEGYRERHKVGPASDVWALSATLYYLLSGKLPFHAQDEAGWILAVAGNMEEQAPKLIDLCPTVSPRLSEIIARGLQKKIEDRYADAMEMKRDLESLHAQELEAIGAQVSEERRFWFKKSLKPLPNVNSEVTSTPDQDNINLFTVKQGEEFDEVAKKFKSTMSNASIVQIQRVQNQAMHQAFLLQLSTLKKQLKGWDGDTMRRKLWHGTQAVEAIVNSEDGYGFLPLLSGTATGAIWGDGTYFARDARYSNDYARRLPSGQKQMILCDVLVGQSAKGAKAMKMCPVVPNEKYKRYNSLVNSVDEPSIFVIQHSNQAYPSYLLTYHE